jgi:hypothetical protein
MKTFKINLFYSKACERAMNIRGSFFMKLFKIKSPSGVTLTIYAESIFHACQIAVQNEGYKFTNVEYLKLNK